MAKPPSKPLPLAAFGGLCDGEMLATIPAVAVTCTGFLVADDVLLTAGHCVHNFGEIRDARNAACEDFFWVFGYHEAGDTIPAENVFKCERVIAASNQSYVNPATRVPSFGEDWALLRLTQKTRRSKFELSALAPTPGSLLQMLGHPLGTPLTSSSGRMISDEGIYFRANLDSFAGNSGSPVFGADGVVKGLLVRGYPDELFWTDNRCYKVNHCDNYALSCQSNDPHVPAGEHIQKITPTILELLKRN